ncbi:MAG: FHA domain-containing protein [Arachnia sp.]
MTELIVAAIKIVFLALLWIFIALVADVIRKDMFGRKVNASSLPQADVSRRKRGREVLPSRFAVTQGAQQGLSVPLEPTINLGRAADSTFLLDDDYASARHAQLTQADPRTWTVRDLNSTNGTYVNGKRLTGPVSITLGDVIRIGKTLMRLET